MNTLKTKNNAFLLRMLGMSLLRRRSRMAVALVGIAIGATVLLGMASISYDIPRQMSREFRSYGANMVFVSAAGAQVALADAERARALLPAEQLVGMTPLRYLNIRVGRVPYTAVGTDFAAARKTSPYWQVTGAWPKAPNEILAGADAAEYGLLKPGMELAIDGANSKGSRFRGKLAVTGIVKTGGKEDGFLFMSLGDMEKLTKESGGADVIELSVSAAEADLRRMAAAVHEAVPALEARLVRRVTQSEASVLGKLKMLVTLVTGIVLVLTMICVATTMMTVVMERRREIGLKKALGADGRRIAREVLAEGLVLGLAGGLIGGVCGLLFAQLISVEVFGRAVSLRLSFVPVTALISALVTMAACLWPVRRAMRVDPAVVLRGE